MKRFRPAWSGDLMLFGTDANAPDRRDGWNCWYALSNVSLDRGCRGATTERGFEDPIFELCRRRTETRKGLRGCLRKNRTNSAPPPLGGRIDFVFARAGRGHNLRILRGRTLPKGQHGCNNHDLRSGNDCFSDHRSIFVNLEIALGTS